MGTRTQEGGWVKGREFSILITDGKDGLFLASALGFVGGGNTVKEALDAWVDAIVDDAILARAELRKAAG